MAPFCNNKALAASAVHDGREQMKGFNKKFNKARTCMEFKVCQRPLYLQHGFCQLCSCVSLPMGHDPS